MIYSNPMYHRCEAFQAWLQKDGLGLAAGILCLHGHQLSKRDQEKLGDALQHQTLHVCPDPCLKVPATATLWMGAADETVSEQLKVRPPACKRVTCQAWSVQAA